MAFSGVYVPLVTPFLSGQIDWTSYNRLIEHYLAQGVSGLVPIGTTGESPTLDDDEYDAVVARTIEQVGGGVPVIVGAGGNHTAKIVKRAQRVEARGANAILSVSPYFNRPDQRGIFEHFRAISEAVSIPILIYNIPYRTGRNVENDTLRRLAELKNIRGVKDSCGDIKQSMDLLLDRPDDFSILTGEDLLYYLILTLGGDGGILAAAHLETRAFLDVHAAMRANDHRNALAVWQRLAQLVPLLFAEPNPAPIKHCLAKLGLIASAEVRLPLVGVSPALAAKLDAWLSAP